jgi:hypothetical protein
MLHRNTDQRFGKVCQKLTIVGVVRLNFYIFITRTVCMLGQDHARGWIWRGIKKQSHDDKRRG